MTDVIKLYMCVPGYGGSIHGHMGLVHLVNERSTKDWGIYTMHSSNSLLTHNFNIHWAEMLNRRDEDDVTHFLMLHSDVAPQQPNWAAILMSEMQRVQADILSVIIPIKSHHGITSTAFDTDPWIPQRLTMKEAYQLPATFTAPDLLLNTGCMLIDVRAPWVEQVYFHIRDKVEKVNGKWIPRAEPEDWNFSRQARALGRSLWATRLVHVQHHGETSWGNNHPWGTKEVDDLNGRPGRRDHRIRSG